MKKLFIMISGPMGIGKTTAAKNLLNTLPKSVMLDGDWCWEQGNHWDFCEDNKEMVLDNICHTLNNFLANPHFFSVIFSWVLQFQETHDEILRRLSKNDFEIFDISLVCDEETLRRRFDGRNDRNSADIERAVDYLKYYPSLNTKKINVAGMSQTRVIDEMLRIINDGAPRCFF